MKVTAVRTKAEQQLLTQFAEVAGSLPGAGWAKDARRNAIDAFAASGLPHRRIEEWKYTDLRTLLTDVPPPAAPNAGRIDPAMIEPVLGAELSRLDCYRFVFIDGAFAGDATATSEGAPQFASLGEALARPGFEWLQKPSAGAGDTGGDPLLALNAAFATDGAILQVKEGVRLDKPVHLVFVHATAEASATATMNLIRIEKGARATILETHISWSTGAHQTNSAVTLHIGAGAEARHIALAAEGASANHFSTVSAQIEEGGVYDAFQYTESPALARNQLFVTFRGEGASFNFNAAFLGRGKSHIDTTMVVDHAVPGCTSREMVKGVLDGEAHGVFQGKVIVRPHAQKSDGKQMAKALLLSPTAEFDSKPELEIYADDVVCGHGSTAAELDEDQVFYLRARGIAKPAARALLTEAFAAEAIDTIGDEPIREAVRARLQAWLAAAPGERS